MRESVYYNSLLRYADAFDEGYQFGDKILRWLEEINDSNH